MSILSKISRYVLDEPEPGFCDICHKKYKNKQNLEIRWKDNFQTSFYLCEECAHEFDFPFM